MIPSRIRSNANWLFFFRLNPRDVEFIYRDAVVMDKERFKCLYQFIFKN